MDAYKSKNPKLTVRYTQKWDLGIQSRGTTCTSVATITYTHVQGYRISQR